MSSRSSTSSFRRSLGLGALLCALTWGVVEAAALPRVAFFGGRRLAEKFVRLEALERAGPVDVFVIGPSHVDQGFDAGRFGEVTGTRAFNLGVQGTDMYFQSILLRDILLSGPLNERAPRAVLWALRDEVLTRSNINRQYLGSTAVSYATAPLGGWAFALGRYLPQFQRRRAMDWARELSSSVRQWSWETARGDERAALRAWMEPVDEFGRTELSTHTRQERLPERDREDEERDEPTQDTGTTRFMGQDYSIDLETAKVHVLETLRLLRARGIAVWFFLTPYHESVCARGTKQSEMLLTGQNQPYYDWLAGLAREFAVPLVDLRYCAEISGQVPYFFDSRHLNSQGAAPLAALLGELFAGTRPLPAAWSGVPAPAQLEFMFGKLERERVPRLSLGERHGLDAFHGVRHDGRLLDLYATFRVERAGRYRVTLLDAEPAEKRPALYARLGGGHYRRSEPPARPQRAEVVLESELAPGEHLLELHGVSAKQALDWDQVLVDAAGP